MALVRIEEGFRLQELYNFFIRVSTCLLMLLLMLNVKYMRCPDPCNS